jgi:hypothetical protein
MQLLTKLILPLDLCPQKILLQIIILLLHFMLIFLALFKKIFMISPKGLVLSLQLLQIKLDLILTPSEELKLVGEFGDSRIKLYNMPFNDFLL